MKTDLLTLVEAGYELHLSETGWLRGLAEKAGALVPDASFPVAFVFDLSASQVPVFKRVEGPSESVPAELVEGFMSMMTPDDVGHLYFGMKQKKVASASEQVGLARFRESGFDRVLLSRFGARDSFGCVAMDAERRGLVVTTMLPRVTSLSRGLRARWQLVAVHLAAAYRLRSRLAVAAPASCVVDANGRVVHASGEATARAARERLRAAVIARDRARTRKHRSKPDEALALWAGLAAGRWSLVDRFERDGRRFIVAWRNDTDPKGPLALSRRERQVVSHLLQGDSLKVAAYALGIAPSTASMAASQARLKLGVRTLSDVARLVANEDAAPASAPP